MEIDFSRDSLQQLTREAKNQKIEETYSTILNSMRRSANCGESSFEITKPFPYPLQPLLQWLMKRNFSIFVPAGTNDNWRRCYDPDDIALEDRYNTYIVSWEDE